MRRKLTAVAFAASLTAGILAAAAPAGASACVPGVRYHGTPQCTTAPASPGIRYHG